MVHAWVCGAWVRVWCVLYVWRECVCALACAHVFTVVCGEQPSLGVCVRGVGMGVWCMGTGVLCVVCVV